MNGRPPALVVICMLITKCVLVVSGAICPGRQLAFPSQGAEESAVNEKCQHFPEVGQAGACDMGAGLAAFRGYSVISMVSLIVAPVATSGVVRSKGTTSPGQKTE